MCRLAYIPKPFDGLHQWLVNMEASAGGDGAGIAVGSTVLKGIKLSAFGTANEIARRAAYSRRSKRRVLPVLWHTRRTSSGGHHDQLCHPFPCDEGWLAHNGHWHTFHLEAQRVAQADDPCSDSRLFSYVVEDEGFENAVRNYEPPGVWLHMTHRGDLAVWKRGGSLWHRASDGAWGSEPSGCGKWAEVADGFVRYGEKPKVATKRPRIILRQFEW